MSKALHIFLPNNNYTYFLAHAYFLLFSFSFSLLFSFMIALSFSFHMCSFYIFKLEQLKACGRMSLENLDHNLSVNTRKILSAV